MKELVSVIILTYNKFDQLKGTVDSLLKQNYPNIQVILSDDGSSNFNYQYVKSLFENVPTNIQSVIILDNKKNVGTVKNFNNAIKKADGSIIVPLSCEDEFKSCDTIKKVQEYFENNDCLICTGKRITIDEDGKEGTIVPTKKESQIFNLKPIEIFKKIAIKNIISGACTYYKKSVFETYRYFDEDFTLLEDLPYYLDYLADGNKIGFLNEITLKYKIGGVSTVKKRNPLLIDDFKKTFEYKIFPRKDLFEKKMQRKLMRNYYTYAFETGTIKKILLRLKYIDVII